MSRKPNDKKDNKKGNKNQEEANKLAGAVNDTETEEFKKLLRDQCRKLRDSIEDEEANYAMYQQEREKLNYHWIVSKKDLEDKISELMNKEREIQDLQENHIMTINLLKQKVKHLLFQNQDQQSELKYKVLTTLKQIEDDHRIKERELNTDKRALEIQLKEQQNGHNDYIYALNFDKDKQSTHLKQEYEREFTDIKEKYTSKLNKLRSEMEEMRANLIKDAESKKEAKITDLTRHHQQKYQKIKSYYADITATNLDMIKQLKGDIAEQQKKQDQDNKNLMQQEKINKELETPLKDLDEEIKKLEQKEKEHEKVKKEKDEIKKNIENAEKVFRTLEYEYEVKLQQYYYLEKEKDNLFKKFNEQIYEIQQKVGLSNLILEKKIANIQENIEIKDLELNQILLTATNIDPQSIGGISHTLEEVETLKNDLISELEQQLLQIRRAHSHMVKAYEGKLSEFVIPVEELGFDPLVPTNTD